MVPLTAPLLHPCIVNLLTQFKGECASDGIKERRCFELSQPANSIPDWPHTCLRTVAILRKTQVAQACQRRRIGYSLWIHLTAGLLLGVRYLEGLSVRDTNARLLVCGLYST
jgi:hypothetical protein